MNTLTEIIFFGFHAGVGAALRTGQELYSKYSNNDVSERLKIKIGIPLLTNSTWETFQASDLYKNIIYCLSNNLPGNSDLVSDWIFDNGSAVLGYFALDSLLKKFKTS